MSTVIKDFKITKLSVDTSRTLVGECSDKYNKLFILDWQIVSEGDIDTANARTMKLYSKLSKMFHNPNFSEYQVLLFVAKSKLGDIKVITMDTATMHFVKGWLLNCRIK